MIVHADLMLLAKQQENFPLIAEYLRYASTEVDFERGGEPHSRTHIIVDTSRFPSVTIGVEGSPGSLAERQFFMPSAIYDGAGWDLSDTRDEIAIRLLIKQGVAKDAETMAAGRAELARRMAEREAAENEAAARRTAALENQARERLIAAWRAPREERQWASILQDLDSVLASVGRQADRSFVAKEAAYRRRVGGRLTDPQLRWLADILGRTARDYA